MSRCPECGSTAVARKNPIRTVPVPVFQWICTECSAHLEGDLAGSDLR